MTDDHTDGTIVERVVCLHVKKWILKYSCRETDLVSCRIVVGIDSLRCHEPLSRIHRLLPFARYHVSHSPLADFLLVLIERFLRVDSQTAVVAPLVRIAYLDIERIQFLVSSFLRLRTHPLLSVYTFAESHLQVSDKLLHALLVGSREILLYIELAHSLAEHTIDSRDTTLPARLLLRSSSQNAAVVVEVFFINLVAEEASSTINDVPLEPVLQHLNLLILQHSHSLLERFRLTYRK